MKTKFDLEAIGTKDEHMNGIAEIIGKKPNHLPYVAIHCKYCSLCVQDKDLERFAVNILKALKSKRLK